MNRHINFFDGPCYYKVAKTIFCIATVALYRKLVLYLAYRCDNCITSVMLDIVGASLSKQM